MSVAIDERVVEMRFDNKQFEEGTKKTLSTLKRLKEALKFGDSSKHLQALEKTANNIRMDGLISGVRALERRFSTLGIVGMRVIQNLTDTMMNTMGRAVDFVTESVVSGGIKRAMNIENAHFQLQALLKDEEKVQAVMDNAMESVDGTAYAYDEAAKAASMFAASGIEAGEDMMRALKGVTGVAAMTNSEYESISQIFTTVAGNGRVLGDELLQLSSRGLNAAATISDFFNKVNEGTVTTTDEVRESIESLTEGATVTEKEIREWVSDSKISFKMFAEAMNQAFGESAKRANETFTGALSNMKSALARIGAGFTSPLVVQNGALVDLFNTLRERINDVKKVLVFDEATGNVDALSKRFTDSVIKMTRSATQFVKNADITKPIDVLLNTIKIAQNVLGGFSAFLPPIGVAFSRVFSDFKITNIVDLSDQLVKLTNNFKITKKGSDVVRRIFIKLFQVVESLIDVFDDLSPSILKVSHTTKVLRILYRVLKSMTNVVKTLGQVLSPVGRAVNNVFGGVDTDPFENLLIFVRDLSWELVTFTEQLTLSKEASKNLEDGFTGIFNLIKLLVDGFIGLINVISPVEKPITSLGSLFLQLFGSIGRTITKFSEWARSSETVSKSSEVMRVVLETVINQYVKFIEWIGKLIDKAEELEILEKIFNGIKDNVGKFVSYSSDKLKDVMGVLGDFKDNLVNIVPEGMGKSIEVVSQAFQGLGEDINDVDLSKPTTLLGFFNDKIKDLTSFAMSNPGINTFATNLMDFIQNVKTGLSADSIGGKVDGVMGSLSGFTDWIKNTLGPTFSDLSAGDVIGAGTVFGGIYSLVKVAKTASSLGDKFGAIPEMFEKFGDVLTAYQRNLNASAILSIAIAVGVLAAALVGLSFGDTGKMLEGAKGLGIVIAAIAAAIYAFSKIKSKAKEMPNTSDIIANAMGRLSGAVSSFLGQLGQALKKSSTVGTILKVAASFGIVVKSISTIAKMYKKDRAGLSAGITVLGTIVGLFTAMGVIFTLLGSKTKDYGRSTLNISKGMIAMAAALLICTKALKSIMKIKFPSDWETKFAILALMFGALATVAIALTLIARIGGGKDGPYKSIIALTAGLLITVQALKKMFKIDLPKDWEIKVGILIGIMAALALVMVAMAGAARLSGGKDISAGGTILGMATFIGAVVSALTVLGLVKEDKLMAGAKALGIVLVALALSLSQAAKISDEKSADVVKAMSTVIGVIAASLGALALIKWESLLKAAAALDSVLLSLAYTFGEVSRIKNDKAYIIVLAMIATVGMIATALYVLSEQPWEGMLASGVALTAVILAFSYAFKQIAEVEKIDLKLIGEFLLLTLAVIPIGAALYLLSNQPWDGMLAAGASLSLTILAFAQAFKIIAEVEKIDLKLIGEFLLLTLAVIPIGAALYLLSNQPWDGMLAAAGSISLTLLALTAVLYVLEKIGQGGGGTIKAALIGIAALDLLIANLGLVLVALGALFQNDSVRTFLDTGTEIFGQIGHAIGLFFGEIIGGLIGGASSALVDIGKNLTLFMQEAQGFFDGVKNVDESTMHSVLYLAEALLAITAGELLSQLFGMESLNKLGEQLPDFGENIAKFASYVKDVDAKSVEGAAAASKMMADVAKNLPFADESLMGKIFGKKSLSEFANELLLFAPAIKSFSLIVKDIDPKSVKGAASAAKMMSEVANNLPWSTDSIMGKIFGKKSLSQFGEELDDFASPIVNFASKVKDIDPKSVKGAASAATLMTEVAKNLDFNPDSFFGKIAGKKSLAQFGEELASFGEPIVTFANTVSGIEAKSVKGAVKVTEMMTSIANSIPSEGGFFGLFSGDNSMATFGENLKSFGEDFKEFCNTMSQITNVGDVSAQIKQLTSALDTAGKEGVQSFISSFNNSDSDVVKSVQNMVNYSVNAIQNKSGLFSEKGEESVSSFVNGMVSKNQVSTDAGFNVVQASINGVSSSLDQMVGAGENAGQGFVDGVLNKRAAAEDAGYALGNAAYEAAKRSLDEHSPSRKMGEVGMYGALGFINKMLSYTSSAFQAGKELGLSALNGARDSSMRMVNYINDNWDVDPVITPRLDLSDLEQNGGRINQLFNDSIYTVRASASMVNSSVGRYNQQANNNDLLSALNSILSSIPSGGGDVYNVNGLSYTENQDVQNAIQTLIRATNVKRRV